MKKSEQMILAIAITLCTAVSTYAQSEWIEIASSYQGSKKWEIQNGSLELTKNKGSELIAVMIGRVIDSEKSKVKLYKWYVSTNDCTRKMGKFTTLDINGVFQYETDFVFGGGNVGSIIAARICNAADYKIREKNSKSLKSTS